MKIIVNQYDLLTAVEKAFKVIRKTKMELLERITICAENNEIIFSANNGISQVEIPCYGRVEQSGTLQIHKSEFDIVKKLSGDITIEEIKGGLYSLTCGKRRITGACSHDFEYVSPALVDAKELFTLNSVEFIKAISKVKYAAAEDMTRPILESVCIQENYLTAIDGYRLAKYNLPITKQERDIVIPLESVAEMEKLIGKSNTDIFFTVDKDYENLLIKTKDFNYKTRLCEGTYMKIGEIIPRDFNTTVKVNVSEFMESLNIIKTLGKGTKKVCTEMNIGKDMLNVKFNGVKNNYEENIEVKIMGSELRIGMDNDFLIDAFKKVEQKNITMQFGNAISPVVIQNEDGSEVHLILPVKLVK